MGTRTRFRSDCASSNSELFPLAHFRNAIEVRRVFRLHLRGNQGTTPNKISAPKSRFDIAISSGQHSCIPAALRTTGAIVRLHKRTHGFWASSVRERRCRKDRRRRFCRGQVKTVWPPDGDCVRGWQSARRGRPGELCLTNKSFSDPDLGS